MVKRILSVWWLMAGLACAMASQSARAELVEQIFRVPVEVKTPYNRTVSREVVVTVFHDDAKPRPYPVAVIGHGRSGVAQERADLGRSRYVDNARWLTQLGFIVAIPTRIGYGDTGGDDVEFGGACEKRNYVPGFVAAAAQLEAAVKLLRSRTDASPSRGIVIGQSYGGASALALAARNVPGIQLVVNFAGGAGGDPVRVPQRPCSPIELKSAFSQFGRSARVPTLWLYAENDLYFGPRNGREWFEAFRQAGGNGEFVLLPANGADGHRAFSDAPELWRPAVLEALRGHGLVSSSAASSGEGGAGGTARRLPAPGSGSGNAGGGSNSNSIDTGNGNASPSGRSSNAVPR